MRFAVLLALFGLAIAARRLQNDVSSEDYFRVGREYRYRFEGHLSAGLPLPGEKAAATRLQTIVRIQPENDRYVRLQFDRIRFGTSQEQYKKMIPFEQLEEVHINEEHERVLALPIRFSYHQGIVSDIEFSHEELAWSSNIKRAVVNMLQINLVKKGINEKTQPEWEKDGDNDYFVATERTIEGECEVVYTKIQKEEEQQWTKNVNFEKCSIRPEVAYGRRYSEKCEECEKTLSDEKLSSTIMYFNVTGNTEKFLIRSVELQSRHSMAALSPEQQLLVVRVNNKMELIYAGKVEKEIPVVRGDRKETLIYNPEWELAEEKFAMTGDEKYLRRIPFWGNRVEMIQQQISKLSKQIEDGVELETTHLVARIVKLLRLATEEELNTIRRHISEKSYSEQVQTLYVDALALAGTKNTISHLFEKINNKEISPVKAAQLFKVLAEIRVSSEHIVDSFWRFCDSTRSPVIRQSCWLSYGSVLNGLCGEHNDKYATVYENKKMCSRSDKEQYVRKIVDKLNQADARFEKVLFVKVLANAGIDTSVTDLEKIILDKKSETIVRVQAIDALRRLRRVMPKKIQNILVPIYKNSQQIPEIRMNALNVLLQTQPEQGLIDLIVRGIQTERSQQIRVFTYTVLKTLSETANPCEKTFAQRISQALSMIPEPEMTKLHSKAKTFTWFSPINGASLNMAALFSNDGVLPKELASTIETVFGGEWNKYLAQVGLVQNNFDVVLTQLLQKVEKSGLEKLVVRGKRSAFFRPADMLRSLIESLKINYRTVSKEEPHAMLYFRYKDMDYAFVPIDIDTLPEVFRRVIRDGQIDLSDLENIFMGRFGLTGAAFFHEQLRTLPTALGMPVYFSAKNPTVAALHGSINVELEPKNSDRFTGLRLKLVAKPHIAATHVTKVEIMCPIAGAGFKLLQGGRLHTPIETEIEMNWEKELKVKTSWKLPQEKRHVAHVEGRPVVFIREWKNKEMRHYPEPKEQTVLLKEYIPSKHFDRVYFETTGIKLSVSGQYRRPFSFFHGDNVMDVIVEPTSETPKELITYFNVNLFESFDIEKPALFKGFFDKTEIKKNYEFVDYIKNFRSEKAYKHSVYFKVETSPKTKEAKMDLSAICDEQMRFCRVKMDLHRSPVEEENRPWEMRTVVEAVLPDQAIPWHVAVENRWGAEQKNGFKLRLQSELTKETEEYTLHADYDMSPETKMTVERIYALAKVWQMWNVEVEPMNKEISYVLAKMTVEPETRRYFNLTVMTPRELVQLKDMEMPFRLPVNRKLYAGVRSSGPSAGVRSSVAGVRSTGIRSVHHAIKHLEKESRPECIVKSNEVKSFDKVIYKVPLTTCYSVLAKDCSESNKFAILMKKVRGEEKKLKVISHENEIVMEKNEERMLIRVNGEKIEDDEWEKYGISQDTEEMYKIDIESVVVYFNGYKAEIKMSPLFKNRQCGLCGHYDGEKTNEFRRADNEETEDIEEFHRSYLSKDNECRVEESKLSKKSNYKIVAEDYSYDEKNKEYNYDYKNKEYNSYDEKKENSSEQDEVKEPEMRNRVLERGSKVCFSVEPVKTCPPKTTEEKIRKETVTFKCLRRSETGVQRLMRLARSQLITDEIQEMTSTTMEQEIRVPRMCSIY